jgi:hypothetical protein
LRNETVISPRPGSPLAVPLSTPWPISAVYAPVPPMSWIDPVLVEESSPKVKQACFCALNVPLGPWQV